MNENAKWKLTKGIAYLFFSGIFWFFPIAFLYSLSVVASRGQQTMMGDPTGITQLLLMVSAIIAMVLLALGIRNIATMKTPTKKAKLSLEKEELSLEKEELQDRLKKIEEKLDKKDSEKDNNPENS